MSQIVKKFIGNNEVGAAKIRLENNTTLRGRNAANSADVNILKVNASDIPELDAATQIIGTPTLANQVVNKSYVDSQFAAVSPSHYINPVEAATTGNITLSGAQTIDGVSIIAGDRVLVWQQTNPVENGVYVASAGSWARSLDFDVDAETENGALVYVKAGTAYGKARFYIDPVLDIGTDNVVINLEGYRSNYEAITLVSGDITNQYIDLDFHAANFSTILVVDGVTQSRQSDYSISIVGGKTRISFLGDIATGGDAALVAGDIVEVYYRY